MKRLPIGIQTFSEIRQEGYLYVDKTDLAVDLINRHKYVFLSRPRRFGKSLFLDTLHNLFAGKKELFAGLAAEKSHDWSRNYPVIIIPFTGGDFSTLAEIRERISFLLAENERRLGITAQEISPANRFDRLIKEVYQRYQEKVVILIDEYDKPILDNIDSLEMARTARELLKSFYSIIKGCDQYIRFTFLTGVSRFSRVSVFSGINNITDISLSPRFATICGYTQHDLETVFAKHLADVDMEKIRRWYNGYNFLGDLDSHVYNPFDILLFLANDKVFESYWFETGTPTFLVKLLQKKCFFLPVLQKAKAGKELLTSFDIERIAPITLLFQTGYLTIKKVQWEDDDEVEYTLGFPNLEVTRAFTTSLLDIFVASEKKSTIKRSLARTLRTGDMEQFKAAIHALFAAIPYHNYTNNDIAQYEGFYASVIFAWLSASQPSLAVENCTNKGRIDMSVETGNTIYIIEFKVDMPGEKALDQIIKKGYAEGYRNKGKEIILIGIGFSSEEKNITEFEYRKAEIQ